MQSHLAAVFLTSNIFLWNFQVGPSQGAVPLYLFLSPLVVILGLPKFPAIRALLVLLTIMCLAIVSSTQQIPFTNPMRFVAGTALFTLAITATYIAIRASAADSWQRLANWIRFFLIVQLLCQALELLGYEIFDNRNAPHYFLPIERPTGLFSEPSHLAVSYSVFIYAAIRHWRQFLNGRLGRVSLLVMITSLFLSPSLTLFAVLLLATAFQLTLSPKGMRSAFTLLILLTGTFAYFALFMEVPSEISARLESLQHLFTSGLLLPQSNTSAAVFFGGASASHLVLTDYPFGSGFLNMASIYGLPEMDAYRLLLGDRNTNDGGSIVFKLITEFGYVGALFYAYGIARTYASRHSRDEPVTIAIFLFPIVAFAIRGASYFDGPILISLTILLLSSPLKTMRAATSARLTRMSAKRNSSPVGTQS